MGQPVNEILNALHLASTELERILSISEDATILSHVHSATQALRYGVNNHLSKQTFVWVLDFFLYC